MNKNCHAQSMGWQADPVERKLEYRDVFSPENRRPPASGPALGMCPTPAMAPHSGRKIPLMPFIPGSSPHPYCTADAASHFKFFLLKTGGW
jgi:hypothetical protein